MHDLIVTLAISQTHIHSYVYHRKSRMSLDLQEPRGEAEDECYYSIATKISSYCDIANSFPSS